MRVNIREYTDRLFAAIEHGDEQHRAWLRAKMTEFYEAELVRQAELERTAVKLHIKEVGPGVRTIAFEWPK